MSDTAPVGATCETCKWWEPLGFNFVDDERRAEGPWGRCQLISESSEPLKEWSPRAYTWDASDYASGLVTREDFGCNEHGRRPAPTNPEENP